MPWRTTINPYKIWLSEVILQQTQIKQGLPYYEAFVTTFPTVFHLAKASEEQVLKLWQGLGYYSRARNLHASAKHIANDLNGNFPDTYEGLLKLKGVGDYTASAIGSICFDLPTAVVDGNVYRVLSRYYGVQTPINSTQGIKEFKGIAQKLIDKKNPGDYNQAIMEFGAIQCKPSNPDCSVCPLQSGCKAFKKQMINMLPVKLKKNKIKKKYFNFIVIVSEDGKTQLQKRRDKGIWQNLYQFPLIESDKPLSIEVLKKHKDFKELTDNFSEVKLYNKEEIIHKLSHQHLYTKFWIINTKKLKGNAISVSGIKKYPVPILISNFIEAFHFNQS
jgi:A/G-specific adenine glycosylase